MNIIPSRYLCSYWATMDRSAIVRVYPTSHWLARLIFLSSLFSYVCSSDKILKDRTEDNDAPAYNSPQHDNHNHPLQKSLEHQYFANEVDFLAKQAMVLGNHPANANDDEISRLKFIEKSLQMELEYIRRLRELKAQAAARADNAESEASTTPATAQSIIHKTLADSLAAATNSTKSNHNTQIDNANELNKKRAIVAIIVNVISGATWPTWAYYPDKIVDVPNIKTHQSTANIEEEEYDYDWISENGFAWHHEELNCREHAYDQTKPIYTRDMWDAVWKAYRESTLYPFPIPTSEECHDETFYVNYTTDGKGRGNFASHDIPKGSLVHSGHPNTVFFLDNKSYWRFVTSLPKMYACDVMEWAWQQDLTDSGNVVLCLNMDEAVFFNDGGWDESMNMGMRGRSSLDFWATTVIKKGEELTYDYNHFEFDPDEMEL